MKIVWTRLIEQLQHRKKAVAAFLAPLVLAQLARIAPGVHIDVSIVDQIIVAAITAATVHQVTNAH